MDSQSAKHQAKKRFSRNQGRRERHRRDTSIYQALGMTQAVWRNNLTPSQRKAFRVAWEAQQEEAQIEALKSPGYVYVLRHPRYAELCKVGETVNPVNRLSSYNCGDPFSAYRFHFIFFSEDTRTIVYRFYDQSHSVRLHGEWFDVTPEQASDNLRQIRDELCN